MSMPDRWMGPDIKRVGAFDLIWGFLTKENSEVFCTIEGMVFWLSNDFLTSKNIFRDILLWRIFRGHGVIKKPLYHH